jgi:hypothetical protein
MDGGMMNFVLGTLFGIVIATVGFTGLAQFVDNNIDNLQETVKDIAK